VEHLEVTLPCVTQCFGNDPCKPEVRHRTMDHPCRSDSLRGPHSALHTSCCHYYLLKQASLMNKVFFVGMEAVLLALTASRCTTITHVASGFPADFQVLSLSRCGADYQAELRFQELSRKVAKSAWNTNVHHCPRFVRVRTFELTTSPAEPGAGRYSGDKVRRTLIPRNTVILIYIGGAVTL
jgi:hypothetical protein